jgi:4-aminobutyrate aminotransferase-like enzyme
VVVHTTHGMIVEDTEGRNYLDFSCGNDNVLGYSHPEIVASIIETARRLDHVPLAGSITEEVIQHAEKLKHVSPGLRDGKVAYGCSGTEAVAFAVGLAMGETRRPIIIAYRGAHHGRGPASLGLTADVSKAKSKYPYVNNVVHVPYPYCYRCRFKHCGTSGPSGCSLECFEYLRETLDTVIPAETVAGIVIESLQGWNGYVVPPVEYMRRLDKLCKEYGILLVDDEVLLNMGSTGKLLSIEHFGVNPSIIVLGKALGFGLPLSAVVAARHVIDTLSRGRNISTAAANPLAIAASLKGLEIIERENLLKQATRVGTHFRRRIEEISSKYDCVGEIRGAGLCIGLELVRDRKSRAPSAMHAQGLVRLARRKGLLLERTGTYGNIVRICPPLIVTTNVVDGATEIISSSLRSLAF